MLLSPAISEIESGAGFVLQCSVVCAGLCYEVRESPLRPRSVLWLVGSIGYPVYYVHVEKSYVHLGSRYLAAGNFSGDHAMYCMCRLSIMYFT